MFEPYLIVREAAEILRLSEYRTRELLRTRRIRGVKPLGGQWRVPVSALRDFLEQTPTRAEQRQRN